MFGRKSKAAELSREAEEAAAYAAEAYANGEDEQAERLTRFAATSLVLAKINRG